MKDIDPIYVDEDHNRIAMNDGAGDNGRTYGTDPVTIIVAAKLRELTEAYNDLIEHHHTFGGKHDDGSYGIFKTSGVK
jgi:hypothetical protein